MNIIRINQKSHEFKMLKNNVLVKLDSLAAKEDTVTQSGIIVETAKNKSQITDRNTYGIIEYVGEDVKGIQKGDHVFWHITSGAEVEFVDGIFMIIDADRILGCSK